MQDGNTADMMFPVARTISLISEIMTWEPGDVIAMGTPAGVGYARTPPVWLHDGDRCEIEIEGIGTLANTVRDDDRAARAQLSEAS
jgi:2-keto-4-pentenoate hydratase/2-oxohepta-3-ene-1,7-dioic acid hydratase in catechol pathway